MGANIPVVCSGLKGKNLPLPVDGRMTKSEIETPPAQGIANSPFLVGREDDEGNGLGNDGPKLWNAQLPITEDLEKESLELLIDLIDLIHEQDTRFVFVEKRSKYRTFCEELQTVQFLTDGFPIAVDPSPCFQKESLQSFIKFSDGFVFVDADIALEALNVCFGTPRNGVCQFSLATSRRSFDQYRPVHFRGEIDGRQDGFVDDVLRRLQSIRKISRRREHESRSLKLEHREGPLICKRVFRQIFCLKTLFLFMGLFEHVQVEIERRCLSGGGWANGNSRKAGIETTCYALMALHDRKSPALDQAMDLLLRAQNSDGSWPAFEGDDPEGCWTTALATIALRFIGAPSAPLETSLRWLLNSKGREGHWFWKWKFRTVDRAVQFNPDKYGWSWFPGTVSWVIPTVFSLIALKQSFPCCKTEPVVNRIQLGTEMLRDRACPQGGWNAGNGIVFGSALTPHIDTTAIALLALPEGKDAAAVQGLDWLRRACIDCSSAYSLAWASIAFTVHQDEALNHCIADLGKALSLIDAISNIEILSLAAIAINAAEGSSNPFKVVT